MSIEYDHGDKDDNDITIDADHDNEGGIYKQDRELKLHKIQTAQSDGQFREAFKNVLADFVR